MSLYKSEKNWLEKVADVIPGLKSYRSHEHRRDTDKRLRDYLAVKVDNIRNRVDELKLDLTNAHKIDLLDEVDLAVRKLRKLADSLRHAAYGYTGVFDQVKMRDEELDQLYNYDLQLIDSVNLLSQQTDSFTAGGDTDEKSVKDYIEKIKNISSIVDERKLIFDKPQ